MWWDIWQEAARRGARARAVRRVVGTWFSLGPQTGLWPAPLASRGCSGSRPLQVPSTRRAGRARGHIDTDTTLPNYPRTRLRVEASPAFASPDPALTW